ncbi:hypothetical protein CAPTEDRAFT_214189 [Capitella teleta]|uniref:Pacifastin domain-containing protein n=1 Tax=Capitella teleta TaxID=283909 RepID=R7TQT9_CAPTE|nr:hypothetical protein CAPTEDRAFT_214189 [Capitella teleta]|eukprot:ELT96029.1 hypothetical protein CAPTEDRAFT_214189 [Capitella teleta]
MKILVSVCVAVALCLVTSEVEGGKVVTTDPPCFTQEDCAEVINCEWGYHRASHNAHCYACECRDEPCAGRWCPEWSKCVNDRLICKNYQCDWVGNCISDVSGLVVKAWSY